MKRYISILLSLVFLTSCLHKTIVWSFYESNKEYVAEKLCINRNVKDSCCFGKCFIEKQTSDEKTKNAVLNILKEIKEMVYTEAEHTQYSAIESLEFQYPINSILYKYLITKDIYQPPPFNSIS